MRIGEHRRCGGGQDMDPGQVTRGQQVVPQEARKRSSGEILEIQKEDMLRDPGSSNKGNREGAES